MRTLLAFVLILVFLGNVRAADADAPPQGILLTRAVAGYDAVATYFVSIQWTNLDSGYVVDAAGTKTAFLNDAVARIIYFEQGYYDEVDHNQYWIDWRAVVRGREVVLPRVPSSVLSGGDLPRLGFERSALEDIVQRFPSGQTLIGPLIDTIKDEASKLSSGLFLQNGKWITAQEAATSSAVPVVGDAENLVTFTTKDGRKYANARVTVTDSGVSVLTSDGGASVPFEQLPDDLSAFPKKTQNQIAAQHESKEAAASAATPTSVASVTAAATGYFDTCKAFVLRMVNKVYAYFYPSASSSPSPGPASNAPPASAGSPTTPASTTATPTSAPPSAAPATSTTTTPAVPPAAFVTPTMTPGSSLNAAPLLTNAESNMTAPATTTAPQSITAPVDTPPPSGLSAPPAGATTNIVAPPATAAPPASPAPAMTTAPDSAAPTMTAPAAPGAAPAMSPPATNAPPPQLDGINGSNAKP